MQQTYQQKIVSIKNNDSFFCFIIYMFRKDWLENDVSYFSTPGPMNSVFLCPSICKSLTKFLWILFFIFVWNSGQQ